MATRATTPGGPTRPILRYHGGKWRLADWIIRHLPPSDRYVEPFAGAASVLLRKPRSRVEVLNDVDNAVVTVFRVLRDPASAAELERRLRLTPYAKVEFEQALEIYDADEGDVVEQARRVLVRSWMGFGVSQYRTGWRRALGRRGSPPAVDWARFPALVPSFVDRLSGVYVESMDALECLRRYDDPATLFYVDPPYLPETRRTFAEGHTGYRHELTVDEHEALLELLVSARAMVALSGYHSSLYDERLAGWDRVETESLCDGGSTRTECLWLNPAAVQRAGAGPLFRSEEVSTL